jgi:phosphoribosyl 1,2-cyclic phosphodiesterase
VRVHPCGVRGSTPAPGRAFVRVGGNTSCVAIAHDDEAAPRLVLDAGTGLRRLSALLGDAPFRGTILLGHLHWDHTHGLPFFRGGDRDDAVVNLFVPEQGVPARELVDRFMSPPAFPIDIGGLHGSWRVSSIDEGPHRIEDFDVLALEIPHTGGRTFGYRVSDRVSTLAYLSDHGPRAVMGEGPDGWGPYHPAALRLCAGADLLIHDSQHTADELGHAYSFGHSAAEYAVELARRAGVARVALFHHDPERTDEQVEAMVRGLQRSGGPHVEAAREDDVIYLDLSPGASRHAK